LNATEFLCLQIDKFKRRNALTSDKDVADLAGVDPAQVAGWREGKKAVGEGKARVVALVAEGEAPTTAGPKAKPSPAAALLVTEDVVRHRTFRLDHEGLCALLGLSPDETELTIKECDKRLVHLPITVEASTTESSDYGPAAKQEGSIGMAPHPNGSKTP
jgi:hypothetical protein